MTVIHADRLQTRLSTLAGFTESPPYTRRAFTDTYVDARRWLAGEFRQAGLDVHIDAAGNLIGRVGGKAHARRAFASRDAGEDVGVVRAPIAIGSHVDTVVGGGRFDGILGVLAALEVAQTMREQGVRLRRPLEVIDFLGEEPSDYGVSCIGSRALVGELTPHMLAAVNPAGETLGEAIRRMGGNPEALSRPLRSDGDVAAFVELHIEQGRVLEAAEKDIGIVTNIVGIHRFDVTVSGRADHAGTTPMHLRRDALVGAAYLVRRADEMARAWPRPVVATVGRLDVSPNASNVVPGEVRLSLEVRSGDIEEMERFARQLLEAVDEHLQLRGLRWTYKRVTDAEPAQCAPIVQEAVRAACTAAGYTFMQLPSGAGHDAAFMARVCPAGMIFIPCLDGRSHSPDEWAEPSQMAAGAQVLYDAVLHLDRTLPL